MSDDNLNINPSFTNSLGTSTSFLSTLLKLSFIAQAPPGSSVSPTATAAELQAFVQSNADFQNFFNALATVIPTTYDAHVVNMKPIPGQPGQYYNIPADPLTIFTSSGFTLNELISPNFNPNIYDLLAGYLQSFAETAGGQADSGLFGVAPISSATFLSGFYNYVIKTTGEQVLLSKQIEQANNAAASGFNPSATYYDFDGRPPISFATFQANVAAALGTDISVFTGTTGSSTWASPSTVGLSWFNNFLDNFAYPANNAAPTVQKFLANMNDSAQQFSVTSLITNSGTTGASLSQSDQLYLMRYQTIYKALFPSQDATAQNAAFQADLKAFYQDEVVKYGPYVTPSQALSDYVAHVKKAYLGALPSTFTSLASAGGHKTIIISDIYALIAKMVESIQEITAAQSQRLVVMTNWQQAYAKIQTQVPVFLAAEFPYLDSNIRAALNGQFNQNILTNIQTQQSLVGDDAKALQSNINQSNDAVSQQANTAQSLIQELNTILSAIFK